MFETCFQINFLGVEQDGPLGWVWGPVQDGGFYSTDPSFVPFLPETPPDLRNQYVRKVPTIIGLNINDGVKRASEIFSIFTSAAGHVLERKQWFSFVGAVVSTCQQKQLCLWRNVAARVQLLCSCFVSDESIPRLGVGLFRNNFENFMMGVLQDWRIIDVYRERVYDAIEFQYTDWPDPENKSARAQEFINVRKRARALANFFRCTEIYRTVSCIRRTRV